ncbi:hypothetical protein ACSHT2_21930 [Bradyrhizobium sp. PUT101]|nr:hypothetical protein [Bradyrhizobium sp.]MDX3968380.1 hypothetical protein [Bradyrhizobium sp.]
MTIAGAGEAGLCALEHEQFDLTIIDVVMPHCLAEHRRGSDIASAARRG